MNAAQERRRADLVRQHANLADLRDAAIAKLCRIAAKLKDIERQLGRYEKLKAKRGQGGELPSSWHAIELPVLQAAGDLPPDGDPLSEMLKGG